MTDSIRSGAHTAVADQYEMPFDDLMAGLFVMVTHHSLTQCEASIPCIVERLDALCRHSEIIFYPQQQKVLTRMRQLWKTRLFQLEHRSLKH